jgi:hypothetical protein
MPLTVQQEELYLDLKNAIDKKEDIINLLKQVRKSDFIDIFTTCGTKVEYIDQEEAKFIDLIEYAAGIGNAEALKAIFNYCKKNSISVVNLLSALRSNADLSSSTESYGVQADEKKIMLAILNQFKEVGLLKEFFSAKVQHPFCESLPTAYCESYLECLNESEGEGINIGLLINKLSDKGILKEFISIAEAKGDELEELKGKLKSSGNYDALENIYRAEKKIAANKAGVAGAICGVIAGLAVCGGLFAASVPLTIWAIIGIAMAAGLVTELVTGGITYAILGPKKLDSVDAEQHAVKGADLQHK